MVLVHMGSIDDLSVEEKDKLSAILYEEFGKLREGLTSSPQKTGKPVTPPYQQYHYDAFKSVMEGRIIYHYNPERARKKILDYIAKSPKETEKKK